VTVKQPKKNGAAEQEMFRRVKAFFVLRGTTYKAWGLAHGYRHSSIRYAILQPLTTRPRRRMKEIRERLLQELGEMASGKMGGVK
jgi:hypothetical protein